MYVKQVRMYWNMVYIQKSLGVFSKVFSQAKARVVFSTVQSYINTSGSIYFQFIIMNSKLISTDFSGLQFKRDVVNEMKCIEPHGGMAGHCGWH